MIPPVRGCTSCRSGQCPRRTAVGVLRRCGPVPHRPDLALAGRECQRHS
ncbi:conserved hypothetical protein [Mycolicibacter sinensis]|uniref:Uncharacterized protein n=1 Tax=Mycolicibacter sinensis (strain JDM601) TaxID=875328 RepID=F5Z0P1_MYCSD|nr:conserved hypothetical protein [Mycolicibacter sinensis]